VGAYGGFVVEAASATVGPVDSRYEEEVVLAQVQELRVVAELLTQAKVGLPRVQSTPPQMLQSQGGLQP
jgi:hypothetical protein